MAGEYPLAASALWARAGRQLHPRDETLSLNPTEQKCPQADYASRVAPDENPRAPRPACPAMQVTGTSGKALAPRCASEISSARTLTHMDIMLTKHGLAQRKAHGDQAATRPEPQRRTRSDSLPEVNLCSARQRQNWTRGALHQRRRRVAATNTDSAIRFLTTGWKRLHSNRWQRRECMSGYSGAYIDTRGANALNSA